MPVTGCDNCGGEYRWSWTEAFDKFGFRDGDGQVETWEVQSILRAAGYECEVAEWVTYNTVIVSIKKDGSELIPHDDPDVTVGYDDPRDYLPQEIVDLLDEQLPE